jgi:hypothetical protein
MAASGCANFFAYFFSLLSLRMVAGHSTLQYYLSVHMPRKRLPTEIETLILTQSRRRCCVCYALKGDDSEKKGQIAHLDQDPSNNDSNNLAFICFDHHDQYDSQTSQSKNLTISEVKQYKLELIEYFKREADLKQSAVEVTSSAAHKDTAPQVDPTLATFGYSSSTQFFSYQFAGAFPGIRTLTWFESNAAVERLQALLSGRLVFSEGNHRISPIWWFGRGSSQIETFKVLDSTTILIDILELRLGRIAAVYSSSYKRLFVYLEAEPMERTGLYDWSSEDLERCKGTLGAVSEEYGIYGAKHLVTRAEYDDNAARINGKLIRFDRDVELRMRYITPYNMIIAPNESPLNSNDFDEELESWLNHLLGRPAAFDSFVETVRQLPILSVKRRRIPQIACRGVDINAEFD